MSDELARSTAEAVVRRSYSRLVAFLAARTRDVAAAEDALSEALAAALADWPRHGPPANPEAWLLTAARRKSLNVVRAARRGERVAEQLRIIAERLEATADDQEIPDNRLALMFVCAHPAIDLAIRTPLMLQVVVGLNAATIASAFLVSPSTMGQRLVRAKNKIRSAGIPFSIPERSELRERLDAVLAAIYAAYAELPDEAIFLCRLVTELLPAQPEALGLLSLLLHAEARRAARRNADGEYVPFSEQDPKSWDARLIDEAERALARASDFGALGRFGFEAAIQSAHVHRARTGRANWAEVVLLYDALLALTGSPVVAINRAVALAELRSARAGLEAMDAVARDPRLAQYQPYWAARAELLAKTGARQEARDAYDMAIGLERDPAVRRFLERRQKHA
jgi:RNA polymerase sigma-70 factor (ECF subfamily)